MKRFALLLFFLPSLAWSQPASEYFKTVILCAGTGCGSGDCIYQLGDQTPQLQLCDASGLAFDVTGGVVTLTSADPSIIFDSLDTDFWIGAKGVDVFQIGKGTTPGTTPFLTLDKDGDVGIGIAAPATNMHIQEGNTDTVPTVEIEQTSTGDAGVQLTVTGDSYAFGIDNSDSNSFKLSHSSSTGGAVLGVGDLVTITTAGDLGIGTPSPAGIIHALSSGTTEVIAESTAASNVQLKLSSTNNIWGVRNNTSGNFSLVDQSAGVIVVIVEKGAPANSLNIDSAGDVGIGTSTQSANIDIDPGTGVGSIEIDGSSGGCLATRDTDDLGWTCSTTLNGVRTDFCCLTPSTCADDCP